MPSAVVTVGIYGGLAVAAFAKVLLRYGLRRRTASRGRHRHSELPTGNAP
jgi:hypothetical protein